MALKRSRVKTSQALPGATGVTAGSYTSANITVASDGTITAAANGGGGGGTTSNATINGRLTTESGVPVSTSDRTAQGTIYFTPYNGNQIGLYTGAAWVLLTFSELSLALSGLTSGKNYDVFIDYNGGTPQIVLSAAWTNDTTRADAIALQDGVYVKSGTTTYRLVGTIRTTGTTTTEDSGGGSTTQVGGKRFVWNLYNQVPRQLSVIDTTDSWSYSTATVRQADNAAGNKVEYVSGNISTLVQATVIQNVAAVSNADAAYKAGIGIDSVTAFSGLVGLYVVNSGTSAFGTITSSYNGYPGLGYHYIAWLEKGGGTGTSAPYGDKAGDGSQSGLNVVIQN